MQMEHSIIGDVLVLTILEDRIEAASSAGFKGRVLDWINQGYNKIVLDLQNVNFIDSSGLGALISSLKSLDDDGDLALCNIAKSVMNLFLLTRMDSVFNIFDSRQTAVSNLSA